MTARLRAVGVVAVVAIALAGVIALRLATGDSGRNPAELATLSPSGLTVVPSAAGPEGRVPARVVNRQVRDQFDDVYLMRTLSSWGMMTQLTDAEITTALEQVAHLGFNGVTVWIGGGRGASGWNEYQNANGEDLWTGTPWASSLGAGWSSLDWIVSEASRLGIVVNASLGYGFAGNVAGEEWSTVTNSDMYDAGVAIATRYAAADNIVWHIMFDDSVSTSSTGGTRIEALFRGINDTEGFAARPVRWMEPANGVSTYSQGWLGYGEFGTPTNTLYSYDDNSVDQFDAIWNQSGATNAPVFDTEPPYAGAPHYGGNEWQQLRERTWSVFIRGGWGINYGDEDWWAFGASDLFNHSPELDWTAVPSQDWMLHQSYIWPVIDEFVADTSWRPDNGSFLLAGEGTGDERAASGTSDDAAVVYFPSQRSVTVDMTQVDPSSELRLRWYDPATGSYHSDEVVPGPQSSNRNIPYPTISRPDGTTDMVLVIDTQADTGQPMAGRPIAPNGRRCFAVAGSADDVAVVNLTPVEASGFGNGLLVSSDVAVPPLAANVNYRPGSVDPNVAVAPIGSDNDVCFENSRHSTVHLVADQLGALASDAFTSATASGAPNRVLDTRDAGPLQPSSEVCFGVPGSPGDAAIVNLTPVEAGSSGNGLLVSSDVVDVPVAANVNFGVGTVDPNVAIVPIGRDGEVCFHNSRHTTVHVVADHLGTLQAAAYTGATASGAPKRVADTRTGRRVPPGGRRCFDVVGAPGDVAVVNLTPVEAAGFGNGLLVSSDVSDPPIAANVNYRPGSVDPNVGFAPIGADGRVCFVNAELTSVHVVADHLGTVAADAYTAASGLGAPERVLDTRT